LKIPPKAGERGNKRGRGRSKNIFKNLNFGLDKKKKINLPYR
jgi:hypothetical protein